VRESCDDDEGWVCYFGRGCCETVVDYADCFVEMHDGGGAFFYAGSNAVVGVGAELWFLSLDIK